jgi:hypothetical protein
VAFECVHTGFDAPGQLSNTPMRIKLEENVNGLSKYDAALNSKDVVKFQ